MQVFIINQNLNRSKTYQIMIAYGANGFSHVYPGKLFTLEEAKTICNSNGFTVCGIGSIWQCLKNN